MTQLELSGERLTVRLSGVDRMLALRGRLDIPLDHVVSVDTGDRAVPNRSGLRALAARVPAAIAPSTFYQRSGSGFLDAGDPSRTLVIGLYHERYSKLVIEVEDPEEAASAIVHAVRAA